MGELIFYAPVRRPVFAEKESLALAASELRKGAAPLYRARLIMLVVGNALNWMLALYG